MSSKYNFTVDLRYNFPEVRDQGIRGTCTAFAVNSCHEHHRNLNESLSEEFLFSCAKTLQGAYDDDGVSIPLALEAIRQWGNTTNTLLPYRGKSTLPLKISDIPACIFSEALNRKIISYNSLNIATKKVDEIENILSKEKSIVSGIIVQPTFWISNDNAFIDVPTIEKVEGYHAVVIVGFGMRDDGKKCFIIRNSWGTGWGDKGYAYISYEYFNKYCLEVWSIPKGA